MKGKREEREKQKTRKQQNMACKKSEKEDNILGIVEEISTMLGYRKSFSKLDHQPNYANDCSTRSRTILDALGFSTKLL